MSVSRDLETAALARLRRTVAGWIVGLVLAFLVALPAMFFYAMGRESQSDACNAPARVVSLCDLAPERFGWMVTLLAAPFLIGILIARPRHTRIYVAVIAVAAGTLFAAMLATGDPNYPIFELHPRPDQRGA
ncbi:hypothetical protein [Oerskovia merdavium]|uniref:Uncharacterized protein n=1 Tax=Oerskovia merdavium TaxID=2762227 RepID=A0ABR8U540_9CELL|nr:hypothetical protein [Oerskovia merdavium]MBD7982909.1 hypothetical protein [Oerskovia merdavium]